MLSDGWYVRPMRRNTTEQLFAITLRTGSNRGEGWTRITRRQIPVRERNETEWPPGHHRVRREKKCYHCQMDDRFLSEVSHSRQFRLSWVRWPGNTIKKWPWQPFLKVSLSSSALQAARPPLKDSSPRSVPLPQLHLRWLPRVRGLAFQARRAFSVSDEVRDLGLCSAHRGSGLRSSSVEREDAEGSSVKLWNASSSDMSFSVVKLNHF
jgi:hypothetical protein